MEDPPIDSTPEDLSPIAVEAEPMEADPLVAEEWTPDDEQADETSTEWGVPADDLETDVLGPASPEEQGASLVDPVLETDPMFGDTAIGEFDPSQIQQPLTSGDPILDEAARLRSDALEAEDLAGTLEGRADRVQELADRAEQHEERAEERADELRDRADRR